MTTNYLARRARKLFRDTLRIKVQGGAGGPGLPKYGGIGGKGGDVYVVGTSRAATLECVLNHRNNKNGWFEAPKGQPAIRSRLVGRPGQDLIINVPLGVSVSDSEEQLIGEINKRDDKILVALGGRGGDKYNDGHGLLGQKRAIRLDYKMISDGVFVGFPNAGKSSLLTAISQARPKIANYPFTTLRPHLGVVQYPDLRQITLTDLPGLVEGSHRNIGIGHEFLKHIVRSRVLIFVLDVNHVDLGPNYPLRNPIEVLCTLIKEIEIYDDRILNKPSILVLNKVDCHKPSSPEMGKFRKFIKELENLRSTDSLESLQESRRPQKLVDFKEILPISATAKLGLDQLRKAVRQVIDEEEEAKKLENDEFRDFSEIRDRENNRLVQ